MVAVAAATYFVTTSITADSEVRELRAKVMQLSYNTASGGGINLKMMVDPATGDATVPMEEVFSFDRNHAMCRVETNTEAFKMSTFSLGEIIIQPHQFFMSMVATSIEQFTVSTAADGTKEVVMRGGLDCATEVGRAEITIGSRTSAERATYEIRAVDGGIGGGEVGDQFEIHRFLRPGRGAGELFDFRPKIHVYRRDDRR